MPPPHSQCGFAGSDQGAWAMRRGRRLLRPLPLGHCLLGCLWSQVSASLAKTVATRSMAAARSARRARWAAASARGRVSSSPSRGTGKLSAAGPHPSALLTMARVQGFGFRLYGQQVVPKFVPRQQASLHTERPVAKASLPWALQERSPDGPRCVGRVLEDRPVRLEEGLRRRPAAPLYAGTGRQQRHETQRRERALAAVYQHHAEPDPRFGGAERPRASQPRVVPPSAVRRGVRGAAVPHVLGRLGSERQGRLHQL